MDLWQDIARLTAEQDQDVANALKWWRETSDAHKRMVWDELQRNMPNPLDEIISRFAQVGMTQVALLAAKDSTTQESGTNP